MIFASKTQPFAIATSAQRLNNLERWLERKDARAVDVGSLQVDKRPNCDLVVLRLLVETTAHGECKAATITVLHEQLVDVVSLPLVEQTLLLQGWIITKHHVSLGVD